MENNCIVYLKKNNNLKSTFLSLFRPAEEVLLVLDAGSHWYNIIVFKRSWMFPKTKATTCTLKMDTQLTPSLDRDDHEFCDSVASISARIPKFHENILSYLGSSQN